ncbi:MAG: GerMN domain-containing protein [Candidatus Aminicenantales bacterium]
MDQKRIVVFGILFCLLVVLVILFFRNYSREDIKKSAEIPRPEVKSPPQELRSQKKVLLFFLREDDDLLYPEEREIFVNSSVVREAEQVISGLIQGSRNGLVSPIPPETKMWQIFLTKEGTAYVDFSKEMMEGHPSGSAAEISTIYSIVDSLAYNFKSIKKVFILIDGEERETFAGHISLDKPFLPDYSIIAKSPQNPQGEF